MCDRIVKKLTWSFFCAAAMTQSLDSQQVADTTFIPEFANPLFEVGAGPVVLLDEAHHNFHTAEGRYLSFVTVLRRNGFRVTSSTAAFSETSLDGADVLVIANALHSSNEETWALPTPSAFTKEEIDAVAEWVRSGGSLFLLADHMPFPGAAADLGSRFGFEFLNGYAYEDDSALRGAGPIIYRSDDGTLADHEITRGRNASESVSTVATFTGQAFRVPDGAQQILTFRPGSVSLQPDTAWVFSENTPRLNVSGWAQGAVMEFGEGRVAVFGEAAMFSAQVQGPQRIPMGMNNPVAPDNLQFLLNVVGWLVGGG